MSGKRRVWFNGKLIHDSKQRFQKSSIPHRFRWEGGGYRLEVLSLKSGENYKVNLIVDDIPFIKLPRRTAQISLKDVLKPRRMCRADGTWGETTAITLGCSSEHLGKRLSGSKRRITYVSAVIVAVIYIKNMNHIAHVILEYRYAFVFLDEPSERHVLEVMYSILSGKREIKVDGELVHKSQKLQMSLKFMHAFKAIGHMFEMLIEEKTDVILTRLCIDGMDFRRLPLLSPDQLRIAIKDAESDSTPAPSNADEDQLSGDDDDDKDSDSDEDPEEDSEEEEEEESEEDNAPKDLLADLFGDSSASSPTSSASSFDPFATKSVVKHTQSRDSNFADSPTVDKVSEVMDPFAQLMKTHRAKTSNAQPPAAPFDPFASKPTGNGESNSNNDAFDPFAGL